MLSRECDTAIQIGPNITVKVLSIQKQRVKLGNAFVAKSFQFDDFCRSVTRTATFWTSECRVPKPCVPQPA